MVSRVGRRVVAALAGAALAALLVAPAAPAHGRVVSTKPSGSAKVGLKAVVIGFSGPIRGGTLNVFNAKGHKVSKGEGGRDPRNVSRLRTTMRSGVGPGRYTARARWTGADGHVQRTSFTFRLRRR